MLANLVWSLVIALPGFMALSALLSDDTGVRLIVGAPLLVLTLGIIAPIMTAGLAHMAKTLIDTRDGALSDFFFGIRRYWGRAAGIGLLFTVAAASLLTSIWFYASKLQDSLPLLGYAISGLAAWCLLLVMFMALLVMPTLVQRKGSLLETIRLTALLILANPLFTAGLALQLLALSASLLIPPFFFFLYGSMCVVVVSSAYEMLARKYASGELRQRMRQIAGNQGQTLPAGAEAIDDSQDDYLNRGFRDFLFPWKG